MPDRFPFRLAVLLSSMLLLGGPVEAVAKPPAPEAGNVALEPMLAGEFALQAGKLDEAAKHYLDAARRSGDVGLAERATRIALLANDDRTAAQALALWKRGAQPSLGLTASEATVALRAGQHAAAETHLTRLLRERDPRGWRYALIVLSSGGKDMASTARVLKRLRDAGSLPTDMDAQLAFAGLAQRVQQPALVDALVADIVKTHPGEPRVQLLQASLSREAGDLDAARRQLGALRARLTELPQMRMPLAAEYEALGDAANAAAVLAEGPQDTQTRALRAAMLSRIEDNAGLEKLYAEAKAQPVEPADPRQRLLLGQLAETLKKHEEALDWYAAVAQGELRDVARLRRASTLHAMGRKDEGFAALRALQNDDEAQGEVVRDAYLAEAELRRKDGDDKGEFDAYARGLAAMQDELAILYARALAWERVDDIPRAEADLRKILVIEPDNVAALNALGYTLADRTTRYREALELIDRARVAEPGNAAIIDSHGWVLYRLGRHEEALVQLKRALVLNKDAEVAAHVAEVLWMMGRKEEAMKYFDEARRIDPEHRALKRALEVTGAGK